MITDKDAKKVKELADLREEYEKTQRLLNEGKNEELQKHLQDLQNKYLVERMVYNVYGKIEMQKKGSKSA